MHARLTAFVLASCIVSLACGKKSDGSAAAGSGEVTAAKPACAPGAWKEPTGLFCVTAPPGFKATLQNNVNQDDTDPKNRVTFAQDNPSESFNVEWFPKPDPSAVLVLGSNMENDYKNNKGEDKGSFANGKGRYFIYTRKDEPKAHKLLTVVQGNKHAFDCESDSWGAPIPKDMIAACESLTATD